MRIVPAFDELKDSQACFCLCVEGMALEQFTFQGSEETFTQGIIVAIADRAHGWTNPGVPTALAEG
jgi:hypothetical protein